MVRRTLMTGLFATLGAILLGAAVRWHLAPHPDASAAREAVNGAQALLGMGLMFRAAWLRSKGPGR